MKKIELLSPAGDMKCLVAAIEAGCDAVYLAGKLFGARSFAGNFTNDEIIEAINYAHLYGVKVYVTINTIIYEREVDNFINFVRFLHKNNVDAVIIQDLGMLDLVRKTFPNLEIHASTQVNIHNYEGALLAKKLGIKRVVMARETSLDVIRKIKKELDLEVEVFVHGALCVSYSGQCLMSSLIGGRSGNRGTCAQTCRKAYDLYDENGKRLNSDKYLLSTKDLFTLNKLDELIDIGVDSFKIEGRMKRPEYVYLVTKIYRKVIDNYVKNGILDVKSDDVLELKKMFNRKFTNGFMFNEENNNFTFSKRPNHKGILVGEVTNYKNGYLYIKLVDKIEVKDGLRIEDEKEDKGLVINKMFVNEKEVTAAKKGDIVKIKYDKKVLKNSAVLLTTDNSQLKNINDNLNNLSRKVLIDVEIKIKENEKILFEVFDGVNKIKLESKFLVSKAINKPVDKDLITKQIIKMGNTVYKARNINISLDENVFVNIKDINELRRNALLLLNEKRLYKIPFKEDEYKIELPNFKPINGKTALINNINEHDLAKDFDMVYTENKKLLACDKVILKLPRIINNYTDENKRVLIGELGSIIKYNNFDTDFSFNVVNSYALAFLHSMGAKKVTLSYELTISQIKLLIENYKKRYGKLPNVEVIYDSYPEAMICKFDLNKKYNVKNSFLIDEFNNKYKVVSNNDFMRIYNFKKIVFDNEKDLYDIGVNYLRKNF